MGAKNFLLTADIAKGTTIQGGTLIPFAMGIINGSSNCSDTMRTVCVEGDEKNIVFAPCGYMTPAYPIPGMVLCKITKLHSSHISEIATDDGKKILYVGSGSFETEYQVIAPAQQPTPTGPIPDTKPKYTGTGSFTETGPHTCEEK
jgi:hypothetical protein